MSAEPPPPPQVSPDGKFYWDGERWVPMPGTAAAPSVEQPTAQPAATASPSTGHGLRNGVLATAGLIVVLIIIGSFMNGSNGTKRPVSKIDLDGRMSRQAHVGGEDEISLTVTNKGPSDFETLVIYLNGKDDWFKHHVITDPSGCTINKDLERLDCGPLKVGDTRTFSIVGSPKDAGNYNFQVSIVDQEGSSLNYPDLDALDWPEAVTP